MPLIHSATPKAFSTNVAELIAAGHPKDQALAISYDIKRKAEEENKTKDNNSNSKPVS